MDKTVTKGAQTFNYDPLYLRNRHLSQLQVDVLAVDQLRYSLRAHLRLGLTWLKRGFGLLNRSTGFRVGLQ